MKPVTQVIEQCIRDWFVAEAETLKLVSAMVTRYRQGGPLEDAHQRLADGIAGKIEATAPVAEVPLHAAALPHPAGLPPLKRGPGRPRKIVPETRP